MTDRVTSDRDILNRLVAESPVAHMAFVDEHGQPFVLPIAITLDGDRVLLHGSTGSRWLRLIAQSIPVSVAVTAVDGLIVARSAFESSMRYRSAVLFGRCTVLPDADKLAALDLMTDALIPGRVAEVRRPTAKELAATQVLAMNIEEFSVKVSDGWPDDPPDDVAGPAWAGVVPSRTGYATALPAPDLIGKPPLPDSVRNLL